MSPFPQSVADTSAFPAVFLYPPGIIQVAFVLLGVPKYLQWPRWIRGLSVYITTQPNHNAHPHPNTNVTHLHTISTSSARTL